MKAYFDQNIWEYVINQFSVSEFEKRLNASKIQICLGTHNIYEFARLFLDENNLENIEKGKDIFQYLSDMNMDYFLKLPDQLIDSDLDYALTGGKLLPFLDNFNITATKEEMYRLAKGYSERAKDFIQNRENSITEDILEYRKSIIEMNIDMPRPREFYAFRDDWGYRRQTIIKSPYGEKAKYISDEKLFSEPENYPYLNTYINAQLYLNFIALTNPDGPSKKSTSDYRHLITANAADCFVTEDKKIQHNSQKLCPYIFIYSREEFEELIT